MTKKFIYDEDLYAKESKFRTIILWVAITVFVVIFLWWLLTEKTSPTTFVEEDYIKIYTVFKATGSPVPGVMTSAVLGTKYPYILTGIAVKESNGTPWAVGDKGKSQGAFQVQPKHWGKVPAEASEQAKQAAAILEALVESRGSLRCRTTLRRTLAKYNGGTRPPKISYQYADAVMKTMKEVE